MIELKECTEQCFGILPNGKCNVLYGRCKEPKKCNFYKPAQCADWIRREEDEGVWLIPPEEYYGM